MYNFEQIGFIPRSIVRTLKRFIKQISLKTDLFVIYEFRISRYIAIASIQCFFLLILCPWIFQILMKFLLINFFFQYRTIAKAIPTDIFINFHQQERAFSQIQTFSQKVYFETLFESFKMDDKRNPETMALFRCNGFASPRCFRPLGRKTKSDEARWMTSPRTWRGERAPERRTHDNQNSEKLTSFDHRFNLKETVLDFVVSPKRCPRRCIHKLKLASRPGSLREARAPTGFPPGGCPSGERCPTGSDAAFKSQLGPQLFDLPTGPPIHWIVQQPRTVARDLEHIFKKDLHFPIPTTQIWTLRSSDASPFQKSIYEIYQTYFLKCAYFYNQQSIAIITNWILDLTTLLFFLFLLILSTPQILILKTFFIESLLSLSETTKCFFLIFFLDLLVGFHSSKSWEIFLQFLIEHFGFQIHQNFIFFFISTFPVLLDTIFKYWIFRYLNKISPSTVATYQAMIE